MKCKQCGIEVVDSAQFCHACGTPMTGTKAPAQPADALVGGDSTPAKQRLATPMMAGTGEDAEQVVWEGRFSKLAMIGEWIGGAVVTLAVLIAGATVGFSNQTWWIAGGALVVLWIGLVSRLLYKQLSIRYLLTNQRFIHERGLLWRTVDRIEVIDVDDVAVQQGPVERMLGVGSVRIRSSDASTPEFVVEGIEEVRQVATQIDEARRKERRRRGVYVEQV